MTRKIAMTHSLSGKYLFIFEEAKMIELSIISLNQIIESLTKSRKEQSIENLLKVINLVT